MEIYIEPWEIDLEESDYEVFITPIESVTEEILKSMEGYRSKEFMIKIRKQIKDYRSKKN